MNNKLEEARSYEQESVKKIPQEQRPEFHFSVPIGWMNDPNGFSEFMGEHHLFFQYYPYDVNWGSMHWGHARSKDFIKWEYLPTALAPDESYDSLGTFSGSAVEEQGRQVLIYTGVAEEELQDGRKQICQNQCIAIGNGLDYKKLECNPVIKAEMLPEGSSFEDFRDPKLWKEDGIFYTVVGSRHADGSGQIALFYSVNLMDWKFGSILDRSKNCLGKMWECPDFFPLKDKHVLMISPQEMDREELEFHNGNNVAFLIGTYDKKTMVFERQEVLNVDFGLDFYAAQTMMTEDGRRIMIAWMQSWDNHMFPADFCWSGMMTVPRELFLRNGCICQSPVRELEAYHGNEVIHDAVMISEETALEGISGKIIDMTVVIQEGDYEKFEVKLAADERFYTSILFDRREGILTFDRTHAGCARDVIGIRSMRVDSMDGRIAFRVLLDRYSVEIFVNDGSRVMSSLIFTKQEADQIYFHAWGYALCNIRKYDVMSDFNLPLSLIL